jgi:hypothetical protein
VLRKQVYDSAKRPHPAVEEAQELLRFWDLVLQWSRRNIKLRYKRSILGVLWTLLEPLMLMTILTIVFSNVFRFDGLDYPFPLYILSGLLLFDFFNRSTMQIVEETVASLGLASRIYVPRSAFAVATVLTYFVNWAIALIPLVGIMMVLRQPLSWAILTIPFGMLLSSLDHLPPGDRPNPIREVFSPESTASPGCPGTRAGHLCTGGTARKLVGSQRIQSRRPRLRLVGLHDAEERL